MPESEITAADEVIFKTAPLQDEQIILSRKVRRLDNQRPYMYQLKVASLDPHNSAITLGYLEYIEIGDDKWEWSWVPESCINLYLPEQAELLKLLEKNLAAKKGKVNKGKI